MNTIGLIITLNGVIMQNGHVFLMNLLLCATTGFAMNQKQTIDITNDSNQSLYLSANNADQSFRIVQTVPAYTRALIISQLVNLKSSQNLLLEAIMNDSVKGIQEAIRRGADINQEIGGQRPLVFAVALEKLNAVKYLVACGAA
jgi:hypothetical protein